jgi:hypothetical protein
MRFLYAAHVPYVLMFLCFAIALIGSQCRRRRL